MSVVMLGPVESMGYPFEKMQHEAVRELEIDGHLVYAFGRPYLYSDYEIEPAEPLDAVICWDPGWGQSGHIEGSRNELARIKNTALHHNVPMIGMYCDWFASWNGGTAFHGVTNSLPYCDGVVTDPVGAAAMRNLHLLTQGPGTLHYRPIIELDTYLTYGRLPHLGSDLYAVRGVLENYPQEHRPLDVSFVGFHHPSSVVHRSYYLEALIEACKRNHWNYEIGYGKSTHELEEILVRSKVCFNTSVGSSLNMRVYEAAAAGCVLLSDAHNTMNDYIQDFAFFYSKANRIDGLLTMLLQMNRTPIAQRAIEFAEENHPVAVWSKIIDHCTRFMPLDDSWQRRPHVAEHAALTKEDVRRIKQKVRLI